MVKDILISIVVPIYKVEKYINKCLNSILNQTYKNLQIILVDDGSPDNCGKICDEYEKKDKRIQVIHKQNGGLSDARNVGIAEAKGEFIGFVDSDDYIEPTMFEDLLNLVKENNADVAICNFYEVKDDKKIMKNNCNDVEIYNKMEILKEILLDKKIQSYAWNKLYKKALFNKVKYPVGKKYEDIGTTFYLLEGCEKVVVSGKPEYYYLNREDSIVNNVTESTIMDYVTIVDERYDYIEKNYPELNKYNMYYLTNILITAFNDKKSIDNISKELEQKLKYIYNKVMQIIEKNGDNFFELLTEDRRKQMKGMMKK